MKKLLVSVVVLGVGAAALGVGALVFTDRQINTMVAQLENSVSAPMTLEITNDQGNLITRQLDMVLSIPQGDSQVAFLVQNTIEKRPWGTSITHAIRLENPNVSSQMTDELTQFVQQNFVEQAFITGVTQASVSGHYQAKFESLPITEKNSDIDFNLAAFQMDVTGDLTGGVNATAQWPGMTLTTNDLEKATLVVQPISYQADGEIYQNTMFLGKQWLKGEGFSVDQTSDWNDLALAIGNYQIDSEGRLIDEIYSERATFTLASVSYRSSEDQLNVKNIQASVFVDGLTVDNYKAISAGMNDMQLTGVPSEQLMKDVNALLRNGFTFELNDWQAEVDAQKIAFNGMFVLPENTVADVNNPFSLMGLFPSVKANANLQFDSGLSDVPLLYDAVLNLLNSGMVVNAGDGYEMAVSLENGVVTLNGEPVPLPF